MTATLLLSIIQTIAAGYVLWHALCAINAMSRRTHHGMRIGVILIAIGAFFECAQILWAHEPSLPEVLVICGLAIGTAYNKRTARCPCVVIDQPSRINPPRASA